ncbi:MAG: hypothetical protein EWV55_12785 [Microcystis viridis Mv_BB_P_19951000_S69]|uniref:Uncharacterized protein n=1 Tax=Microcystis viridis Mv_BB_P_19951000_S68D TaxID=2486270 RepID=A0A552HW88_MICVR|nr:MAG: hypothetical protein EWV47_18525 [Microcystis viridis Mv_BB_P_19951000_S68]TRU73610.1 MAG: hypothetical protein EWV55_12785 [Microcystis viridis Mv_BB_P_19951000_S69]TRU75493.1 MAG: hypothetical protein EWV77_08535 [Microcystis viridis Mv_BB_P_19951000_S68D]TRU88940.1 MAG: hypothetical protein EWV46_04920 [Microcystis viridis Mv_BB_P_19951000_S69D]
MPNNNNQPDINKAIDVCMEEYKTLRTEISQTIQNRTNVIVFGGALVLTLLGIGISPIANLPIMKETTTVTRIPSERVEHKRTDKVENNIRKVETTWITEPTSKDNLVIKEQATTTEKIYQQPFYDIPIERRIPSAIILGIIVPVSCGLIIFLVNASNHQVVRIGRYIATNIEPKINDLYFNNLPSGQKPIVWETYMQTLRFGPEEGNWVTVVFGGIALFANVGGIFSILNIAELNIALMLDKGLFILLLQIVLAIVFLVIIIFILWVRLKTGNKIIQLRDGEGSLRKIWYKGINRQNEDVKSTRIFWKSNYRVWEMYQINDFKNLFNEIKNYSRNPEYNPPFYFNLDKGGGNRINNIPELLELSIDNPDKFKEHMEQGDFENWLDNIEIRETELANIAQATREKTFPNDNERLHYFLRECCLVLIERNP